MSELQRFRQDMDRLGNHPDKALINQLTYFAEVNKRSKAKDVVNMVSSAVLSPRMPPDRRLPLCYLMDSVLKNVEAPTPYPRLFSTHVKAMSCLTFETGTAKDRQNVKKLLRTWRERTLFDEVLLDDLDRWIKDFERREEDDFSRGGAAPGAGQSRRSSKDRGHMVGDKRRPPPADATVPPKRYHAGGEGPGLGLPPSTSRHSAPPPDPRPRPPAASIHVPTSLMPSVPVTPPAPPTATAPPTTTAGGGGADFASAVEQEMNTLLDQLRQEIGYAQRLTITELRQMNPALADQFKATAEAAVAARFAVRDGGAGGGSVPGILKAASMVASDLASVLQAMRSAPPPVAPPPVPVEALNLFAPAPATPSPYGLSVVPLPGYPPPPPGPPPHLAPPSIGATSATYHGGVAPGAIHPNPPQTTEDLGTFTSDTLNKRSASSTAMITRLYNGEACPDCGRRLPSSRDLADHMDFHYQQKKDSKRAKQATRKSRRWFAACPTWVAEGPWIGMLPLPQSSAVRDLLDSIGNNNEAAKTKGGGERRRNRNKRARQEQQPAKPSDSVPVDEAHAKCKLCGEPFEQFWDERESEFMFRNAVRVIVEEATGKLEVEPPGGPTTPLQPGQTVLPVHKLCFQGATDHEAASRLLLRQSSSMALPPVESEEVDTPAAEE